MRTFSVSFFLGTLVLLLLPYLPANAALQWWFMGGLLLLFICAGCAYRWRQWRLPVWIVSALFLGSSYALFCADRIRAERLPAAWEGEDKVLQGIIADLPSREHDGVHFLFDVDDAQFHGRLRLGWYAENAPDIRAGERWQLVVRAKRPHGLRNPNGFDFEQWLFAQRIGGTGSVRKATQNQWLAAASVFDPNAWRQTLRDAIAQALPDSPQLGVVQGLAVADTHAISLQQWDVFRKTGTIHLLAISGLHITMVAGLGLLPVWLLWWCFPRWYLYLPQRIAAGIVGGVLATIYALLAGMNIPTQRTLLMLLVMLLGLVLRREIPFSVTLSFALLLVLLLDPLAPLTVGFWLSFMTVGLLVFLGMRQRKTGKFAAVWMQLVLSFGTVPLAAGFFGMVSLSSPLANLLAIPLVTFVVTPLVLLGLVLCGWWGSGAAGVWWLAAWLLDWLMKALQWLADLPLSTLYLPLLPFGYLLLAGIGFVLLMLPRGMPGRWLGVLWMLPLFCYQPERPLVGAFRLDVLDVGQGLASVIQTAHHSLVFDTGAKSADSFDMGAVVVLPWLRGQGITHLDRLMVSHADTDHSGGARALLAEMPTTDIWVSAADTLPEYPTQFCQAGQTWEWDGVSFTVLHPSADFNGSNSKDNNRACVLRISNSQHSVLLSADIEREAETWLVQHEKVASEVLLIPHHGSKTSSSPAFIEAVAPSVGIITSGYRNRFNHPHPSVVARYAAYNIKLLNTVDSGELRLDFPADNAAISIRRWRYEHAQVWDAEAM